MPLEDVFSSELLSSLRYLPIFQFTAKGSRRVFFLTHHPDNMSSPAELSSSYQGFNIGHVRYFQDFDVGDSFLPFYVKDRTKIFSLNVC